MTAKKSGRIDRNDFLMVPSSECRFFASEQRKIIKGSIKWNSASKRAKKQTVNKQIEFSKDDFEFVR